jgi:poly [ADP-ribose] polymerase 10/14/15
MRRTDPAVRKRCREKFGDQWFAQDKKARQDEVLAELTGSNGVEALTRLVATHLPDAKDVRIERLHNPTLRRCYDAFLHSCKQEERVWLFHGTTEATSAKIRVDGFNRSFCGKNATLYGRGVYFARDISYSARDQYSTASVAGRKHIFACRVVTGHHVRGDSNMLTPGWKDDKTPYLTSVDQLDDPSIFVIYKDMQANPEFLITFST